MVSALAWFEVCTLGPPMAYALMLLLRKRTQARRKARTRDERSVAAITARVERERESTTRSARWPRIDLDRGVPQAQRERNT